MPRREMSERIIHKIHSEKEGWGGKKKEAFSDLFPK